MYRKTYLLRALYLVNFATSAPLQKEWVANVTDSISNNISPGSKNAKIKAPK